MQERSAEAQYTVEARLDGQDPLLPCLGCCAFAVTVLPAELAHRLSGALVSEEAPAGKPTQLSTCITPDMTSRARHFSPDMLDSRSPTPGRSYLARPASIAEHAATVDPAPRSPSPTGGNGFMLPQAVVNRDFGADRFAALASRSPSPFVRPLSVTAPLQSRRSSTPRMPSPNARPMSARNCVRPLGTPLQERVTEEPWWFGAHGIASIRDYPMRVEPPGPNRAASIKLDSGRPFSSLSAPCTAAGEAKLGARSRLGVRPRSSLWHSSRLP